MREIKVRAARALLSGAGDPRASSGIRESSLGVSAKERPVVLAERFDGRSCSGVGGHDEGMGTHVDDSIALEGLDRIDDRGAGVAVTLGVGSQALDE